jgi:hypothetical protein
VKSRTECCTWASIENWECADGKESDNEYGSRDGDGASDDEDVALLQRCWLRLLSLVYHALPVGSLLQLFRRYFSPPSSESTQSAEVFRFSGRMSIVWRTSFGFTRRVVNTFRCLGRKYDSVFRTIEAVHLHIPHCWTFKYWYWYWYIC